MARKSAGLGERHRKILQFLKTFQDQNHYSPSIRQIGESINVSSTSLVDYYLRQLEEMGLIEREERTSRSIRVIQPAITAAAQMAQAVRQAAESVGEFFTLPVAGRIVASQPLPMPTSDLSYYDAESTVEIARSMLPARENVSDLFALEVSGDSMIDAMINDGDIVIMKRAQEASNGEMVAVWLNDNDETTLKYFYKENKRVRLQPANPTMGPIFIDNPAQVRIMGKVVMVIRKVPTIAA
jgi:repressor LexA